MTTKNWWLIFAGKGFRISWRKAWLLLTERIDKVGNELFFLGFFFYCLKRLLCKFGKFVFGNNSHYIGTLYSALFSGVKIPSVARSAT